MLNGDRGTASDDCVYVERPLQLFRSDLRRMEKEKAKMRISTFGLVALFGAITLTAAGTMIVASPAQACELEIGRTYKEGNFIVGYGSMDQDCQGESTLTIQWQRVLGIWQDRASADVGGPGYDQYVRWDCSKTGTHTFRTINTAQNLAGAFKFKASNEIRVTC